MSTNRRRPDAAAVVFVCARGLIESNYHVLRCDDDRLTRERINFVILCVCVRNERVLQAKRTVTGTQLRQQPPNHLTFTHHQHHSCCCGECERTILLSMVYVLHTLSHTRTIIMRTCTRPTTTPTTRISHLIVRSAVFVSARARGIYARLNHLYCRSGRCCCTCQSFCPRCAAAQSSDQSVAIIIIFPCTRVHLSQ